jgi:uncharacterized phage protein gp47/JayE
MIKKWEKVKGTLEKERDEHSVDVMSDVEVADDVLKDLRGILKDNSEISIRNMILKKLRRAIEKDNIDDAVNLSHVLNMIE